MEYNLYNDFDEVIKYNRDLILLFKNYYNKNKLQKMTVVVEDDIIKEIKFVGTTTTNEFVEYVEQKYKVKINIIDKKVE
jgi:hypothetical protein